MNTEPNIPADTARSGENQSRQISADNHGFLMRLLLAVGRSASEVTGKAGRLAWGAVSRCFRRIWRTSNTSPIRGRQLGDPISTPDPITAPVVVAVVKGLSEDADWFTRLVQNASRQSQHLHQSLVRHHFGQVTAFDLHFRHWSDTAIAKALGIEEATAKRWHEDVRRSISITPTRKRHP